MRSSTLRRGKTLSLLAALLAAALLYWFVSARTAGDGEIYADYVPVGNNFARFTSDSVELTDRDGVVLASAPFDHAGRALTVSGEIAAAWSPGGEVVFLAAGGCRDARLPGTLLGLFGSDCGAVAAICEIRGEAAVLVYGQYGEALRLETEEWPIAAAISPDGSGLAVLTAGTGGFSVGLYGLADGRRLWTLKTDRPEYDLEWADGRTLRAFGGGTELYIDGPSGAVR